MYARACVCVFVRVNAKKREKKRKKNKKGVFFSGKEKEMGGREI